MNLDLDKRIFKAMILEEWRLHRSLVGGLGSAMFPLLIFILTVIITLISPFLLRNLDASVGLQVLHITILFYGIFVGGFGVIGETVMTHRLGQVNMLLQLPLLQPICFKRVMSIFYLKDALFYLGYTFVPMLSGMGFTFFYAGFDPVRLTMLGITIFTTFMMGMGLSFVLSALPGRSKSASLISFFVFLVLGILVYPLGVLKPHMLLLPLGYWVDGQIWWLLASGVFATISAALGALLMKERYEFRQRSYGESFLGLDKKLGFIGELRSLVAKELLELSRSGAMGPTISSYTIHLLFIYFLSWLFESGFGIPIGFNVIFFSCFVGFMGVMTYGALTGHEHNEYLNVLPVSVDYVIRAKLAAYFLLTGGVSVIYVIGIGFLKGELGLVPGSIIVAACTSFYVVTVTAYLTGLWTNTMFFGSGTILRFTLLVIPPLTVVGIGALLFAYTPVYATYLITGVSALLFIASVYFYRRLRARWSQFSFSLVTTK